MESDGVSVRKYNGNGTTPEPVDEKYNEYLLTSQGVMHKALDEIRKMDQQMYESARDRLAILTQQVRENLTRPVFAPDIPSAAAKCELARKNLQQFRVALDIKREQIAMLIKRSKALWDAMAVDFQKAFKEDAQRALESDAISKLYEPVALGQKIKEMKDDIHTFLSLRTELGEVDVQSCDSLDKLETEWATKTDEINRLLRRLANHSEDLSGSVRVYVRLKPCEKDCGRITASDTTVESIDCQPNKRFGPFYRVFHKNDTNQEIYAGQKVENLKNKFVIPSPYGNPMLSMYPLFEQVEDEYHVVLFSYGYSGSGKTFTLIGNQEVPGILQLGLANLRNVNKIRLIYAFEQVPENVTLPSTGGVGPKLVMTPKIYVYQGNMAFAESKVKMIESKAARGDDTEWSDQTKAMVGIDTWIQRITKHRMLKKTIRPTPNNPESSRSHLYLSFEIEFNKGKRGYVTIVDMAGREDPFALFEKLFDVKRMTFESSSFKNEYAKKDKNYDKDPRKYYASSIQKILEPRIDFKELQTYLKTPSDDPIDAINLIREGFYINESINHLRFFFKSKMGTIRPSTRILDLKSYTPKSFIDDVGTEQDIKNSSILMIPILKWLDHGIQKDQKKPTKFAMLCAIRQESNYCTDSIATLEFADSIKST